MVFDSINFIFNRIILEVREQRPAKMQQSIVDIGDDAPVSLIENPYKKAHSQCILCAKRIQLDYKNARLLQQFVSTFSGRLYERHVTGLCERQQERLSATIALSRRAGYMPIMIKDPRYLRDPKLFDPLRPVRKHNYA